MHYESYVYPNICELFHDFVNQKELLSNLWKLNKQIIDFVQELSKQLNSYDVSK